MQARKGHINDDGATRLAADVVDCDPSAHPLTRAHDVACPRHRDGQGAVAVKEFDAAGVAFGGVNDAAGRIPRNRCAGVIRCNRDAHLGGADLGLV